MENTLNESAETPINRALDFSFRVRADHKGNVSAAFNEFVNEPDIAAHWQGLGGAGIADMLYGALLRVHEARGTQAGGNIDFLPLDIRVAPENAPQMDAARALDQVMYAQGAEAAGEACERLAHELAPADCVKVFAFLAMTLWPPLAPVGVLTPGAYVDAVAAELRRIGAPVADSWTQEDDGHHEGLIEIARGEGEGARAFSWHSERGWMHLWRHGPLMADAFSRYSNAEDLAGAEEAPRDVVRAAARVLDLNPDQTSLL